MKHVGCQHIRVWDDQANIGFPVFIMYPAAEAHGTYEIGPFSVTAGLNAPAGQGPYPVVVISHGSGGNRLAYLTLAQALAEAGYVVMMPEHFGNNKDDNFLEGKTRNLELRPRHITLCLNALADNDILAGAVQTDNAALLGHSMGGYTGLAVAGGKPWSIAKRPVPVTPDARIKALVLMAPATDFYTPDGSLSEVTVPILAYHAEHDTLTPFNNVQRILDQVPDKGKVTVHHVENAGHLSFLSPFPEALVTPDFIPAQDPEGFDRVAFHQRLTGEVVAFLDGVFEG